MNPLSKSKAKYIKSLQLKKNRYKEGVIIVEGEKSVLEFINSDFKVKEIICTDDFFQNNLIDINQDLVSVCSKTELSGLGSFKTNNSALAVVVMKQKTDPEIKVEGVILALDQINDPGNLGTIIRIADWFGIDTVLISENSVDLYSPKVVSSTKGSFTRVEVLEVDLKSILNSYNGPVYAAVLDGEPLTEQNKLDAGIILMGSESHGINRELNPFITKKITIQGSERADSLNVAVATGIICHHLLS